jgi:hypothetical protein
VIKNPFDKLCYYCIYCHNIWYLKSNNLITSEQIKNWFEEITIEHYKICNNYRTNKEGA